MAIRKFHGKLPLIGSSVYIDESAVVIGDVMIGDDSSVWPGVVIRGDVHGIEIGSGTNVQDNSVLHVTHDGEFSPGGYPLIIGDDVTIGHQAVVHACRVGNRCLVGIGAIVMDGVTIEDEVIIGAGGLVPPGKTLECGNLYVGTPVKKVRSLKDSEREFLRYSAKHYQALKDRYLADI